MSPYGFALWAMLEDVRINTNKATWIKSSNVDSIMDETTDEAVWDNTYRRLIDIEDATRNAIIRNLEIKR